MLNSPTRAASTTTLAAVFLAATTLLAQQLAPASPEQSVIAKLVCQMIEKEHLARAPVNDGIASKLVNLYVKELDPQKLYFLQSDIEEFNSTQTQLDDDVKAGKLDWAFMVFARYLERLDQRIEVANANITATHDYTVKESMSFDAKELPWAQTTAELDERWRKRVKYDLLMLRMEKTPDAEAQDRLTKRYRTIKKSMHQMESDEVLEIFLTALASCFDPHSSYMSPRTQRDFEIQMRLSLDGIGAALKGEDGYTTVAQIVAGGAASRDGRLKVKDRIVGVGQSAEEIVDVVEMKLTHVVNLIRGKRGTKVFLKVIPNGSTDTKLYELTRDKVELKSQEVRGEIIDVGQRLPGQTGKIGVIHVPSFYRDFAGADNNDENFKSTTRDFKAVLKQFETAGGVDAILIDLRFNGGGALAEAIELSGLFIEQGPVLQVKDQHGNIRELPDDDPSVGFTGPVVVACNRLSASASEIFAGVIRDYQRGLIVGDTTTHGKGTVQSVMSVSKPMFQLQRAPERGAIKLTIQQFYRANGDSTQNLGVPSDISLPSLLDHMDLGESSLENAIAFDRVPAAEHKVYGSVTPTLTGLLKERSRQRIAGSKDFGETQKTIQKYVERKKRKVISLNEEELLQERLAEEDKTKKEVEQQEEPSEGPIFPVNYYNDELLSITADYVNALKGNLTAKK